MPALPHSREPSPAPVPPPAPVIRMVVSWGKGMVGNDIVAKDTSHHLVRRRAGQGFDKDDVVNLEQRIQFPRIADCMAPCKTSLYRR